MYSYEDRIRAVKLYINCGKSASVVVRKLGYPSKKNLRRWYQTFVVNGDLPKGMPPRPRYSAAQKQKAVDHYFQCGECISHTRRTLGYPSRSLLARWIEELHPGSRKVVVGKAPGSWSMKQKQLAVIELCARQSSASAVADELGVSREVLYKWKSQLLDDKGTPLMTLPRCAHPDTDGIQLEQEVESLRVRLHRLQLEHDILRRANELLKKELGVDLKCLSNREKTLLVDALRTKYTLPELLALLGLARSSYFYHRVQIGTPDKYAEVRRTIADIFSLNYRCYGYRRIHSALSRNGTRISENVVRRLMSEQQLVPFSGPRRRYNAYRGEVSPAPENRIERDFTAAQPNEKWLTDLTEFSLPSGKVYLSPIIDCFDGLVVSWTIGTRPDADLVNVMLDEAVCTLNEKEHRPTIHSDRGAHYRWPGWLMRVQSANLIRSMSAKGCTPDNAACEGFFGRLKNEFFYPRDRHTVTLERFMEELDSYLHWYNEKRIKVSLGGLSPTEYRAELGYAA